MENTIYNLKNHENWKHSKGGYEEFYSEINGVRYVFTKRDDIGGVWQLSANTNVGSIQFRESRGYNGRLIDKDIEKSIGGNKARVRFDYYNMEREHVIKCHILTFVANPKMSDVIEFIGYVDELLENGYGLEISDFEQELKNATRRLQKGIVPYKGMKENNFAETLEQIRILNEICNIPEQRRKWIEPFYGMNEEEYLEICRRMN